MITKSDVYHAVKTLIPKKKKVDVKFGTNEYTQNPEVRASKGPFSIVREFENSEGMDELHAFLKECLKNFESLEKVSSR